jgi:hypothetical protein
MGDAGRTRHVNLRKEYSALLEQAGYELTRIIPTATPLHAIEGAAR